MDWQGRVGRPVVWLAFVVVVLLISSGLGMCTEIFTGAHMGEPLRTLVGLIVLIGFIALSWLNDDDNDRND